MGQTTADSAGRSRTPARVSGCVVGLGQCSLDFLCTIERYPAPDTKCEFDDLLVQGGGPVATALVVLVRWGVSARFSGVVCPDRFGRMIHQGLDEEGIDTSALLTREGSRSQFAFICVEKGTGSRTIFWGRPNALPFLAGDIPEEFLKDAAALHLDGLFLDASLDLAKKAKDRQIPVILDAGTLRPGMLDLIRHTDHLIAAENFLRAYMPSSSITSRLSRIKEMGPQVVTVTLGRRGSVSLWDDVPYELPALPVEARDTTGAGDVFHGAYIYGLLHGWAPQERIRWATVAAGLSCRHLGGRSGIPPLEEVRAKLSEPGPFLPVDEGRWKDLSVSGPSE
jgi:sulfofructose kinase